MSSAATPTTPDLDLGKLFERSWKLFAQKPFEHIVAGLVVSLLAFVTLGILAGPLTVGYIRMIDKQTRGEPIQIGDVFEGFDVFVPSLLATFIILIAGIVGLILFVLPGLVVFVGWGFAYWFIALRGQSGIDALGSSWQLLKRHVGSVIVVFLLVLVLSSAGSAILLATLLTFPFSLILMTLSFHDLAA